MMNEQDPAVAVDLAKHLVRIINDSGRTEEEVYAALKIVKALIPLLELESNGRTYIGGRRPQEVFTKLPA